MMSMRMGMMMLIPVSLLSTTTTTTITTTTHAWVLTLPPIRCRSSSFAATAIHKNGGSLLQLAAAAAATSLPSPAEDENENGEDEEDTDDDSIQEWDDFLAAAGADDLEDADFELSIGSLDTIKSLLRSAPPSTKQKTRRRRSASTTKTTQEEEAQKRMKDILLQGVSETKDSAPSWDPKVLAKLREILKDDDGKSVDESEQQEPSAPKEEEEELIIQSTGSTPSQDGVVVPELNDESADEEEEGVFLEGDDYVQYAFGDPLRAEDEGSSIPYRQTITEQQLRNWAMPPNAPYFGDDDNDDNDVNDATLEDVIALRDELQNRPPLSLQVQEDMHQRVLASEQAYLNQTSNLFREGLTNKTAAQEAIRLRRGAQYQKEQAQQLELLEDSMEAFERLLQQQQQANMDPLSSSAPKEDNTAPPSSSREEEEEAVAQKEWVKVEDPMSGEEFYWNSVTGEMRWDMESNDGDGAVPEVTDV